MRDPQAFSELVANVRTRVLESSRAQTAGLPGRGVLKKSRLCTIARLAKLWSPFNKRLVLSRVRIKDKIISNIYIYIYKYIYIYMICQERNEETLRERVRERVTTNEKGRREKQATTEGSG